MTTPRTPASSAAGLTDPPSPNGSGGSPPSGDLLTGASPLVTADEQDVEVAAMTPVIARRTVGLHTARAFDVVDVTDRCRELLDEARLEQGSLVVFTPHTTCAVKINEREDCFLEDLRQFMEALVPPGSYYRHDDLTVRDPETCAGLPEDEPINGHSHIKQMLLGAASETVPVVDGELALGRWQRILFIELDQARPRHVRLHAHGWR